MKEKAASEVRQGMVYWITGLSGSGKTTIGKLLYEQLRTKKPNVVFLDADELHYVFGDDQGNSVDALKKSSLRNGRICEYLAKQGCDVVCATVSMLNECGQWNRKHLKNYCEIYLQASDEIRKARNTKDFQSLDNGKEVSRVDALFPFEEPTAPDLTVNNDGSLQPEEVVQQILSLKGALA